MVVSGSKGANNPKCWFYDKIGTFVLKPLEEKGD